jgi:TolB protein
VTMRYSFIFALSVVLLVAGMAAAQPTTTPREGSVQQTESGAIELIIRTVNPRLETPLAVPDALNQGGSDSANLTARISVTLRRDLELAGYFQLLTPAMYFFDQHADGMTDATVNFQNWFRVGAQGLVKTAFREAGGVVRLDFRLFNVDEGREINLPFEPVQVAPSEVESHVHEFANQIVEYYSGLRGPFGTDIAFVGRGRDGSREIYRMQVGDDRMAAVTNNGNINILPEWARGEVVFTTYVNGNPDLVAATGGALRTISSRPGLNTGGVLSPDGSSMAICLTLDGQAEIYLLDPNDGSIQARLTNNRAEDVSPVWSPDGSRIAFVSDRSGGPQIYLMYRDGSDQRRLTFAGSYNTTPDWSPDGTLIAFTGRDSRNRFDIFTVDVASSHIDRVTQDQGNNEDPSWSPDGQYLVFTSDRGGDSRLYIATADGNFQSLLTREGGGYTNPAWRR